MNIQSSSPGQDISRKINRQEQVNKLKQTQK